VWLIGAVVCLLAANSGSNCSFARAMDGRIVRCGIISSCQSATTSKIVKSASGLEEACKKRYSKYMDFTLSFMKKSPLATLSSVLLSIFLDVQKASKLLSRLSCLCKLTLGTPLCHCI